MPEITLKLVAAIAAGTDDGHMNDKMSISVSRSSLLRGAALTAACCAAVLAGAQSQATAAPSSPESPAIETTTCGALDGAESLVAAQPRTCQVNQADLHIKDIVGVIFKPKPAPPTGPLFPGLPDRMWEEFAIPGAQEFWR